ncbi:MAG: hypothetical protein ABSC05_35370 [Candidatus Solibacter sp.]
MNRLVYIAAAGALLVFGAAAQDTEAMAKKKAEAEAGLMQMKMVGAVKGMTVKGVPYSGEEVNQTDQMLADGTRIHRENRTTVYRDSEGRSRRETPDNITITDPVANVTYMLDPKTMTGQKLTMAAGNFAFVRTGSGSATVSTSGSATPTTLTVTSSVDGPATITLNGVPLDEKAVAEAMAKAKASGSTQTFTYERRETTTGVENAVGAGSGAGVSSATAGGAGTIGAAAMKMALRKSAGEPLGKQTIEGVNAEGTREVSTIDAGAIGNDRPIQVSTESWYSADLQMNVMTKHSDPRTGDESFRLTNINRAEPAAYLFQPPAGYQITERK